MIEQYTITTTPKYNFPPPTMDMTLPKRFVELSLHSLEDVQNQAFQLNQQFFQQNTPEQLCQLMQTQKRVIPLTPRQTETTIAAVDTSSIKLGETIRGIIVAVRGTTVWKKKRSYTYLRVGPFIFHITEENLKQVYNMLLQAQFPDRAGENHPGFTQIPLRMASILEKWLQASLARNLKNAIILFDGSLTAGTPETPIHQLREILYTARIGNNTILAFTKTTTLRFNGYLITDNLSMHVPPCLIQLADVKPKPPLTLLGDVHVAKLTKGNCAFRLDIDKELSSQQKIEAVEKLLGNDTVMNSYPETLRLAHILCTFTANEVIAMQHFIQQKYRLKIIERPDMHQLLFGPFGKGESRNEAL